MNKNKIISLFTLLFALTPITTNAAYWGAGHREAVAEQRRESNELAIQAERASHKATQKQFAAQQAAAPAQQATKAICAAKPPVQGASPAAISLARAKAHARALRGQ